MNKLITITGCLALLMGSVLTSGDAVAAAITDLHNTGTAPFGSPDPHYDLISAPNSATEVVIPRNPVWVAGPPAEWISVSGGQNGGPGGSYIYRTTFTIPSYADLSSVVIQGDWASDNVTTDILVNGGGTGLTNTGAEFKRLTPFQISGPGSFRHGLNRLDFEVNNSSGPTGLLVTNLRGSFVPEPGTAMLVGLGLLAASLRRRV